MSITLASLATQFLERNDLSKSTVRSYESTLLPLLQRHGQCAISTLTRQQLEQYLNSLSHLSYTTHNRHQAIVVALLNFAIEQGYLSANPLTKLKRRKPDRDKGEHGSDEVIRYLTPQQLELLYSRVKKYSRLHTLILLLHGTGARIGEALALDFEQLDLDKCKFQVVGKGNKKRWCFYGEDLALVLEKYNRYYRHPNHPALFTAKQPKTKIVTRLSYQTAYRDWHDLTAEQPQLKGFRLHDLRHTFATERVGLMGIEELKALMGHEKIETTLRYQKVTSSRAEEVAKQALSALREKAIT
ncbi:tyrosine-type recombinase/integrase [Myxosarcina sp. GI1]|uniref:tyrosine-type recombinase/integrase n=1 Tax=Myxosarcina sp. GI1 TaxID=1541065 RepID=UPI00055E3308|nr:tyrosine-type recombinase/integrase [Myxosarcina sp. GI1]